MGRKWDEYFPLPGVWRKGRISSWCFTGLGLGLVHALTGGTVLPLRSAFRQFTFLPLADIFTHLVKFPPTQTPPHDGYGKNTAELGIHPWENWNVDHIPLRITGVCYLSGTSERQFCWKICAEMPLHPSPPFPIQRRSFKGINTHQLLSLLQVLCGFMLCL